MRLNFSRTFTSQLRHANCLNAQPLQFLVCFFFFLSSYASLLRDFTRNVYFLERLHCLLLAYAFLQIMRMLLVPYVQFIVFCCATV